MLTGSGRQRLLGLHSHLMKCGLQPNLAGHASGIPGEVVIRCSYGTDTQHWDYTIQMETASHLPVEASFIGKVFKDVFLERFFFWGEGSDISLTIFLSDRVKVGGSILKYTLTGPFIKYTCSTAC